MCTGSHRDVNMCFCSCHSEAETLARLGFFPATPTRPLTAFQFLLLDKLEAFMLECQVPLKDFLAALNCYTSLPFMQVHVCVKEIIIIEIPTASKRFHASIPRIDRFV